MSDLFVRALKSGWRYPSTVGDLTTEQLFDLPLTSSKGASLNNTATILYAEKQSLGLASFVDDAPVDADKFGDRLEVVKLVIAERKADNAAIRDRKANADRRSRLLDALARKQDAALEELSEDEIKAALAEL